MNLNYTENDWTLFSFNKHIILKVELIYGARYTRRACGTLFNDEQIGNLTKMQ